jgi:4-hydroxybenzoate polyprenyltransferase
MQSIKEKIEKMAGELSEKNSDLLYFALCFCGIIALRIFIEFFVASKALAFADILVEYLHNFFFFAILFLIIWLILSLFLQENPKKSSFFVLCAFWLIILPPILDIIKTGGKVYWSFYALSDIKALYSQFMTIFGQLPSGIVYFGTKIVFLAVIFLTALLVYVKTKNAIKTAFSAFFVYVALFFMGSFPSWFSFGYYFLSGTKKVSEIQGFQVVQFWGAPAKIFALQYESLTYALAYHLDLIYFLLLSALLAILFFAIDKNKFWAVIKNSRLPQIIVHGGLFFLGLGIGWWAYPQNLNINLFSVAAMLDLLVAIILAWLASVIINDIADFSIDAVSNPARPLQEKIFSVSQYLQLGIIFFLLSLLGGLVVSLKFAALFLIYQFLAWAYSAEPFRLKKFPLVATCVSSVALLIVFFAGFTLVSGDNNLAGLSWRVILLLLISFTLVLPLKDFRDIEGDRKDKIWTIPVIFGDKNGRLISAVGAFIPFILSVFFLNEARLFWWAVLFGSAAFFVIITKKPRQLFWWVLGIAAAYGIILVKIIFL